MLARISLLLIAVALGDRPLLGQEAASKQPNILLIVSDDAGWSDFGFHGSEAGLTPRLDQLARQGVVCEQAYVSASVCCPSRAGLMTGRYQQRFGHEFNGPGNPEPGFLAEQMGLSRDERTLGSLLQARGYATAAMGKWHLGSVPGMRPRERGFETWFGFLGGSRSYFALDSPSLARQMQVNEQVYEEENIEYLTDTLADRAADFVRTQADDPRPFFLYLAFNAPHTPMHARPDDLERFSMIENKRRRQYAAMLYAMDRGIGRVIDALEESGQTQNTLVVFLNDNGGATNNGSDNGPWRGRKGSKWEGGLRVPCLVRWPVVFPAGQREVAPISSLDLAPTFLAAAGDALDPSDPRAQPAGPFDGVSRMLDWSQSSEAPPSNQADASPPLYWRRGVAAALREGPWKLVRVDTLPAQLMHLERDPSERTDYASEETERVRKMLRALVDWERELGRPRWTEGPRWAKNQVRKHTPEVDTREEEEELP